MNNQTLESTISNLSAELALLRRAIQQGPMCTRPHVDLATKQDLDTAVEKIMATQAQITATLQSVAARLEKSAGETATLQASVDDLKAKIAELEKLIQDGDVSAELETAVAEVARLAAIVDENIPDPVTIPDL